MSPELTPASSAGSSASWLTAARLKLHFSFVQWGWLIPAVFPLALTGGRAAFNMLFYAYIVWALLGASAPAGARPPGAPVQASLPRLWAWALGACLLAYLPGLSQALDPSAGLKSWATVVLYASVLPITATILNQHPDKLGSLLRTLGLAALATVLLSYVELGARLLSQEPFEARLDMRAVDLPFCLPFLLGWIAFRHPHGGPRWLSSAAAVLAVGAYVVLSDERGSVIGLLVALMGVVALMWRLPLLRCTVVMVAVMGLALLLNGEALLRGLSQPAHSWFEQLNELSSWRLVLWSQALDWPPAQPWLGVGMANVQYYPVTTLPFGLEVRHLHNVWLDTWYETGWLGLAALLSVMALAARAAWQALRKAPAEARVAAAMAVSAALAVLAQAQFSISYASREFNLYCLLTLAIVVHLNSRTWPASPPKDTQA